MSQSVSVNRFITDTPKNKTDMMNTKMRDSFFPATQTTAGVFPPAKDDKRHRAKKQTDLSLGSSDISI
jgi:hypothetical protein